MSDPVFDIVPVVQDKSKVEISFVRLAGINLKHGSPSTDRGRLYGRLSVAGGVAVVSIHNAFPISDDNKVCGNDAAAIGVMSDLLEANDSGITGNIIVRSLSGAADVVLIVSFATDEDVLSDRVALSAYPGFDDAFGLTAIHAQVMRELMTSTLPSILPNLFGGALINSFVPMALSDSTLPDLSTIVNPDALRQAQARLVEFHSAAQKKYVEEWAAIATAARDEYIRLVAMTADANAPKEAVKETTESNNVAIGSFRRG